MIGRPDDESAEGTGGEFHEVDGNDAPCALDAELFKECRGHDFVAADESVWVQQRAADDGDDDDAEASTEDLGGVPDHGAACHGAQVGDYLRDGDSVGGEVVFVLEHERIEILRAVGHEVEPRHEEDQVD